MEPIAGILAWIVIIFAGLLTIAWVRVYLYFRCPRCGSIPWEGWMAIVLLPFGLGLPGLLLPVVGPLAVIVAVAIEPKWLLDFTVRCGTCECEYHPAYTTPEIAGAPMV